MSNVTNVLLCLSLMETEAVEADLAATTTADGQYFQRIAKVEDCQWGGSKYPECDVWAAAFNHLDEEVPVQDVVSRRALGDIQGTYILDSRA